MHFSEATVLTLLAFTTLFHAFPYSRELSTRDLFPGLYHDLKLRSPDAYPITGNTKYPRNYAFPRWKGSHGHHMHKCAERSERVKSILLERGRSPPRPAARPAIRPVIQPARKATLPAKQIRVLPIPAGQSGSPPRSGTPPGHGTSKAIKLPQTSQAYTKQQLIKASPRKLGGKASARKKSVKPRPKSIFQNPFSGGRPNRSNTSHAPKTSPPPHIVPSKEAEKGNKTPAPAHPGPASTPKPLAGGHAFKANPLPNAVPNNGDQKKDKTPAAAEPGPTNGAAIADGVVALVVVTGATAAGERAIQAFRVARGAGTAAGGPAGGPAGGATGGTGGA